MERLHSPVDIYKLLDGSNCKECGERTCMAFAAAVFKGQKPLGACPRLAREIVERHGVAPVVQDDPDRGREEWIAQLKQRIATVDLASLAEPLGASYAGGKLTIKCLGKDFSVDGQGGITTDIHVNPWITVPLLDYILSGGGPPLSGKWVPFRELEGGRRWYRLFGQRCEKPLKKVADTYADLFADMLHIFNGKQVENHYASDISLVLHPLPRVPLLICYWLPEDDLESELHLFFDATAEGYLSIESLYTLGAGLTNMFERIAATHA